MQARSWIPVVLLGFAAFGCGANKKMLEPTGAAGALKSQFAATAAAGGASSPGAVYTLTNAAGGNAVIAWDRSATGALSAPQSFPTGGNGAGAGLGNQGALALGIGNRWLYVVNAGSNDVSAFGVGSSRLDLVDRVASGGERPISVTASHDLVYVLNAGGTGSIQGFRASPSGTLSPIPGSNRPLSTAAAVPAQIGFTPDGSALVVSEKGTNSLSVYAIGADGVASGPVSTTSSGPTPFGFGFDQTGTLVVSEAFGGGVGASAVSSYHVARGGAISLVSGSVPTTQTAACWIAVQANGRFAYTTNTGSASVVGYAVGNDGSLSRLDGVTATAAGPTDMAFSNGSRFLYVLSSGAHTINAYAADADGHLTSVGPLTGTPAGLNGLVAR